MNEITYIAHHGVEGQHWGQRNGPPYPLKAQVSKAISASKDKLKNRDWNKTIETGKKVVLSGLIGGTTWGVIPVAVATIATGGTFAPLALGVAFAGGVLAEGASTYIRDKQEHIKEEKNQNG